MSFSWLAYLDRLVFGRYHVEVFGSITTQEALSRLQNCVKPWVWPMFLPREGLYGTVSDRKISFSRTGGGRNLGTAYEFVGTLVSSDTGTTLVGEVHAKWYLRAAMILLPCFYLVMIFGTFVRSNSSDFPGVDYLMFPLIIVVFFFLVTVQLRRFAEGMAHYIGLVVGNAFSLSPPPFLVS